MRHRQRDPAGRTSGKRSAGRTPTLPCFSFPSAQGDQHRRRRDDHHPARRVGCPLPAVAPARHVGAGYGSTRRQPGHLRVLSRARLQLPDDRHPGGGRPAAARARLPEIVARRRAARRRATGVAAAEHPRTRLPHEPAWARTNWQSYCVRLPDGCDQREVMQAMLDAGVSTPPRHHVQPSRAGVPALPLRQPLPNSEQAQDQCILLPLFPDMTRGRAAAGGGGAAPGVCCGDRRRRACRVASRVQRACRMIDRSGRHAVRVEGRQRRVQRPARPRAGSTRPARQRPMSAATARSSSPRR